MEVDAPTDALRAARLGAPVIMLDNFTPDMIQETVSALEAEGLRGAVELEASGGITLENVAGYGRSGGGLRVGGLHDQLGPVPGHGTGRAVARSYSPSIFRASAFLGSTSSMSRQHSAALDFWPRWRWHWALRASTSVSYLPMLSALSK